jgi:acetaldehyde dehydrogenase
MVAHRLGVASTWKSSSQLGDVPDPLVGSDAGTQKAGV